MIKSIEGTIRQNSESTKRLLLRRDTGQSQNSMGSVSSEVRTPRLRERTVKYTLADFELGAKIGAGTFGVIHRAVEKKTKKEYAIKMISKN